jgi:glycosyltransferase involved in cell wall biosynthesis
LYRLDQADTVEARCAYGEHQGVLVIPSISYEDSPLILLEALGATVIVSDVPGTTELIKDGRNVFYFARGTPDRLAGVPLMVGDDSALVDRLRATTLYERIPANIGPGWFAPPAPRAQGGFGLKPVDAVAFDVGAHIVRSRQ